MVMPLIFVLAMEPKSTMFIKLEDAGRFLTLSCFVFRSVSASYKESKDLRGIEVYRYTLLPNTLAAPAENPDNHCYCKKPEITRNCTMAGALDLSPCQNSQFAFVIQNQQDVKASQSLLLLLQLFYLSAEHFCFLL